MTAVLWNSTIDLCSFAGKASLAAAPRHSICHPETPVELVSTPNREWNGPAVYVVRPHRIR